MDPEFNKMFSFKYKEAAFVMNLPIVEQQQVLADSKLIEIYLAGFSTQSFACSKAAKIVNKSSAP